MEQTNLFLKIPKKAYLAFAAIAVIIAILAVAIGIVKNEQNKEKRVEITNLSVLSSVPPDTIEHLKSNLIEVVHRYFYLSDDAVLKDVSVRENTYTQNTKQYQNGSVSEARFLIDIDSLEQTYEVILQWSDDIELTDTDAFIGCPSETETKYPGSTCPGGLYGLERNIL